MDSIAIDKSRFLEGHQGGPEATQEDLWIFTILDKDICFWGRYSEAVSTAKLYASKHGLSSGTIALVDCANSLRGETQN